MFACYPNQAQQATATVDGLSLRECQAWCEGDPACVGVLHDPSDFSAKCVLRGSFYDTRATWCERL